MNEVFFSLAISRGGRDDIFSVKINGLVSVFICVLYIAFQSFQYCIENLRGVDVESSVMHFHCIDWKITKNSFEVYWKFDVTLINFISKTCTTSKIWQGKKVGWKLENRWTKKNIVVMQKVDSFQPNTRLCRANRCCLFLVRLFSAMT